MKKKLHRNTKDGILFGVCAGLGDYLNVDVAFIRVISGRALAIFGALAAAGTVDAFGMNPVALRRHSFSHASAVSHACSCPACARPRSAIAALSMSAPAKREDRLSTDDDALSDSSVRVPCIALRS